MRILIVNHEYPPIGGGGATACAHTAAEYAKEGHEVTVVTATFRTLPAESETDGVRVVRVSCKRGCADHSTFLEMLSYLVEARKTCIRLARTQGFDVVHVFFGIPSGPIGLCLKRKFGIPYVVSLGGGDIPGAQSRFVFAYRVLGPSLKRIWKNALAVVANSQGLLKRAMAFSTDAIFEVIPNGIDPADFVDVDCQRDLNKLRLVTAARIIHGKGLYRVVQAMPTVQRATGKEISYTVLGDGPAREELEAVAAENGVSDKLSITGMLERADVLARLQQYDVFVLPSDSEGMSNAVLEAMASGLPIVMTNCEGSEELVCGNGYVVPLGDRVVEGFIKALSELAQNEQLRIQFGKASRAVALERYTWEKTADAYQKLFEEKLH